MHPVVYCGGICVCHVGIAVVFSCAMCGVVMCLVVPCGALLCV